jgi:two-component system sensor histidine kinase PilS (NtrC family)
MHPSEVRRKLSWLIAIRVVISTLFLGWATLVQIRTPGLDASSLFGLIGLTYALSVLYATLLPWAGRAHWAVDVQLAGDVLVVSAFIALTGGVNSYFSSLYVLPVLAAAGLQRRRGAVMVAVLDALVYCLMVLAQYEAPASWPVPGWLREPIAALPPGREAVYTAAINVFGFFAVALLSGSLAESLRRAGARLDDASTEIANLQAVNQHVIDSLTSGLVTTDPGGTVATFNRGAEEITGWTSREAIGQWVGDLLQLPATLVAGLEANLHGVRVWREDFVYRRRDRRPIDLGLTTAHLVTPQGRAGFLFNFQDVTEVRKLERDARMQSRLAAVGEMAAGIAHEIRNPLASISGSIQILRQEIELNAEQRQLMDIVLRESERLNGTISSFLAYARPQRFAVARVDVAAILRDAALLLRNSVEVRQGHVIEVDVPEEPVWYEADEGQIRQIIWNLATNALRAMASGGCLRLKAAWEAGRAGRVAGEPEGGSVILVVEDQGVGIPAEELDDIFQPFHGAFAKGSGLGLAIVHRIVNDYNGEIEVTSRPGEGTSVTVRLPVKDSHEVVES